MADQLSPELVLVSPPDLAGRARAGLPPVELWGPLPAVAGDATRSELVPFAIFCTLCAVMTLAPLAVIVAVH